MPVIGQGGTGSAGAQGGNQMPQREFKYKIVGNHLLNRLDESDILKDIAARIQHGRRLIIPIGLPQAGKSMFIASLIAYAFNRDKTEDNSCNFDHVFPKEYSGVKKITDALNRNDVLPSTAPNEITIIDLDMKSHYRKRPIKITLIDLSGEDVARLTGQISNDPDGTAAKIEKILAACIARKAIFALLTPVDANMSGIGEVSQFDIDEDSEMKAFIDKIKTGNPQLYRLTKFLMVITKWDTLPKRVDMITYLKLHRTQLSGEYASNSKAYGLIPYSVGNVVSNTIINIVLRSPKNFWYTLYRWCTGKHPLPWWKRMFS
jgi:hypothetical protein